MIQDLSYPKVFSIEVAEDPLLLGSYTLSIMAELNDYPSVTKTVDVPIIVQCSDPTLIATSSIIPIVTID